MVSVCGVLRCFVCGCVPEPFHTLVLISPDFFLLALPCVSHADSGAIYGGRDLSSRGVKMINNYFHHINHLSLCNAETSCIRAAIYVDDFQGGVTVSGNIFYKVFTSFFSNQGG